MGISEDFVILIFWEITSAFYSVNQFNLISSPIGWLFFAIVHSFSFNSKYVIHDQL